MILKKRIPKNFYKLFRTKNMDHYMLLLLALYEENNRGYSSMGLTVEECRAIIAETMAKAKMEWIVELEEDREEDGINRINGTGFPQDGPAGGARAGYMQEIPGADGAAEAGFVDTAPSAVLKRLVDWGWLKSDYDERLNSYTLSFPAYSQLFAELFQKLNSEDDSRERESILSVYSALFTYHSEAEKNNDILKNALRTSRNLGQLLSNMRDGMRLYFDELSSQKNFIGIQEVLVREINNSDSKRYAILTTTDSFYRYKEAVKELIGAIINDNERQKRELERKQRSCPEGAPSPMHTERAVAACEEADALVYQIEREFDVIERKYNKLIDQKAVFAKRALARIHYILQEGTREEDSVLKFIRLLGQAQDEGKLLEELGDKIVLTAPFRTFRDGSLYNRRDSGGSVFEPAASGSVQQAGEQELEDFVPKPLYTKKELEGFRQKNTRDGVFVTTKETVRSAQDLEKLLFLWQEMVETGEEDGAVQVGGELKSGGFTFSELRGIPGKNPVSQAEAEKKEGT